MYARVRDKEAAVDDSFELLEQRVQKAAARLQSLAAENATLRAKLEKAAAQGERTGRETGGGQRGATGAKDGERTRALERELGEMRRERDEIRSRIAKLVRLLDTLE